MFIVTVAGTASGWALAALREARSDKTKQRRTKKPGNDQETGRNKDSALSNKTGSVPSNDNSKKLGK